MLRELALSVCLRELAQSVGEEEASSFSLNLGSYLRQFVERELVSSGCGEEARSLSLWSAS